MPSSPILEITVARKTSCSQNELKLGFSTHTIYLMKHAVPESCGNLASP